jgi:Fe-S-cluster containining protein
MRIEKEHIKQYLQKNPDVFARLQQIESEDPFKGSRCKFLAKDGSCAIYPVRPVVCRSHGAPIKLSLDDIAAEVSDVCPLNFKGVALNTLSEQDHIRLNTLNTILAAVNEQYVTAAQVDSAAAGAKKSEPPPRFDLNLKEIMK